MGQILRQARAAGLKTQFMGPEGVANVSLSNIAGESAEGLLVTQAEELRSGSANKPIVDAIKAKNRIQVARSSDQTLTPRCNLCRRV